MKHLDAVRAATQGAKRYGEPYTVYKVRNGQYMHCRKVWFESTMPYHVEGSVEHFGVPSEADIHPAVRAHFADHPKQALASFMRIEGQYTVERLIRRDGTLAYETQHSGGHLRLHKSIEEALTFLIGFDQDISIPQGIDTIEY